LPPAWKDLKWRHTLVGWWWRHDRWARVFQEIDSVIAFFSLFLFLWNRKRVTSVMETNHGHVASGVRPFYGKMIGIKIFMIFFFFLKSWSSNLRFPKWTQNYFLFPLFSTATVVTHSPPQGISHKRREILLLVRRGWGAKEEGHGRREESVKTGKVLLRTR